MKSDIFFNLIQIDKNSTTPKYLQLSNSLIEAVSAGRLSKNVLLPSINELSFSLDISRDTAQKGYNYLKNLGFVNSVPGKGYFIVNTDNQKKIKILLLFNKLSAHKKIIYDSFVQTLGENVSIDFYIYNNNFFTFKKLIQLKHNNYTHYVIIPNFVETGEEITDLINTLPKEKLILLDKKIKGICGNYAAIYQNFQQDIFKALFSAKEVLEKYHTLKIISPISSYFTSEITNGFQLFCNQYNFKHAIVNNINAEPIKKGEVYINLIEDDLAILLEKIIELKLELGKDVGVISYNETPLKKLLLNGITTFSADFKKMGSMAAQMIINQKIEQIEVPFSLTLRASL
ncbi:MAG: GntR family transcriptional regulator [Sphingobacteriales bacterium]|nr:MAG: GntR family transcriptional regulator [Sphingobacteriales bacterium]